MKIRDKLTLITSLSFGIAFTVAAIVVYFVFYNSSKKIVLHELEKTNVLAGVYYLEKDELSQKKHSLIKQQFIDHLQHTQVQIYDKNNLIQYGDKQSDIIITNQLLNKARHQKKLSFEKDHYYYAAHFYRDNQGDFVVVTKSDITPFQTQSNQLLLILIIVLVIGLLIVFILSHLLSNIAYKPITNIINQVNTMELDSIDKPIQSSNSNDEIQDLIDTFNNLLHRLSNTFAIQKNFINYVSHEFKTPLAAISGHLEVFAQKERTAEEYHKVVDEALQNVYCIEEILNTLMMISGLKSIKYEKEYFRIDELIWNINDKMGLVYCSKKIQVHLKIKNHELLKIKTSEAQLQLALYNLIENALKYSDENPVEITLEEKDQQLKIAIQDYGIGILPEDLKHIHQAFYRGKNSDNIKGSGLGLSLTTVVLKQNNILFSITSEENKGTLVELYFPKL
ncbi:HAMP domain-containing histidine kinase [Flavobacterium sp. ZT3R18]|uniref:sensor histidine kinase n=1 Tax=Flavobacterium sp. ZT3R18 TaxID=2594429 RepID=UPI00117B08B4|nr:HAMP domain-containing sensor histidine kinase [Flavobacterium sp. ZT3R18]TRX35178.1 HAMP domain-containing histidine kinase [Flavobacterium sp. ZT3R18]